MTCSISCSLATIFIIAMIYMNNAVQNSSFVQNYKKRLPYPLQELHTKISNERLTISYTGYTLGFILSIIIIYMNSRQAAKDRMSLMNMICTVVATCFLTNYFYYILTPKTDWMLNHIKSPAQTKLWLEMYRHMQVYYHSGLVFGIVAVALIAYAFGCSN